jgi:hypothetical protein
MKRMSVDQYRKHVGKPALPGAAHLPPAKLQRAPAWSTPTKPATEEQVMREIVAALRFLGCETPAVALKAGLRPEGYFVRTSQRRGDLAGSDSGCPDILVAPVAELPLWLGVEVKRRKFGKSGKLLADRLQPEQVALRDAGAIIVVSDALPVVELVKAYRRMVGNASGMKAALTI